MRLTPVSLRRFTPPGSMQPDPRSPGRLGVAAFTLIATVLALVAVALHARATERALDEAAERTLRDYSGYAARLMGSELLRHSSEQRARVLDPVTGAAHRPAAVPSLADLARLGNRELDEAVPGDPGRGFFRLDLVTGALEATGAARGPLGARIADSLRVLARTTARWEPVASVVAIDAQDTTYSVAFAPLLAGDGRPIALYGYSYTRGPSVAHWASEVFHQTPLLPTSFAGARWNYDTARVGSERVPNPEFLAARVTDRSGRPFWESSPAAAPSVAALRELAVISTASGGIVVEMALRAGSAPALIPTPVRRAQRWAMGALLALILVLAVVSLVALRTERSVARARRAEAMQQLALGLRHELNNALASVLLNAELLAEQGKLDDEQVTHMEAIVEQAERMRAVLRRLERSEHLDVVVPYLDEALMVDLSGASDRGKVTPAAPPAR